MRLGESAYPRLKACLLISGAVGCALYAGVLLRRQLQRPGPPPPAQCPFADNTVTLLRDLHDGPFRFGDPTPVAAAARREALRRIRRQQAHRRHLRRKMRLRFARSQQTQRATVQSPRRSTLRPTSPTADTIAHTETSVRGVVAAGGAVGWDKDSPLPRGAVTAAPQLVGRSRSATEGSDFEGRFGNRRRQIQERHQQHQHQQQQHRRGRHLRHPTNVTDTAKTFVRHARAMMMSSPVDGVPGTTCSLTSSLTGSEAWELSDTGHRRRPLSARHKNNRPHQQNPPSGSPASSFSSLSGASFSSYSSSVSSTTQSFTTSTTTSTSTSTSTFAAASSSSVFASASSPVSGQDETASVMTAGSAVNHERMGWNATDLDGPFEAHRRSTSTLSQPIDSTRSPLRRVSGSTSHAASTTLTSASPHPPSSTSGGGGGGNGYSGAQGIYGNHHQHTNNNNSNTIFGSASAPYAHRHSHPPPTPQPQLPCTLESTTTSSHYQIHSSSQSGSYMHTASYPDVAFPAATGMAPFSSAGGEGEEPYGYPIPAAMYGPPLFATEMDVTDALAELRGSACYISDRQSGSCLGGTSGNAGIATSNASTSHAANFSALSNAGSLSGHGGGGGGGSSTGAAHFAGGALTLSTVGQPSHARSTSSHGYGASSAGYAGSVPSYYTSTPANPSAASPLASHMHHAQAHQHNHSRGHRSSGQGGTTTHHHPHHRSSSAGGSGPHQRVSSNTSQRHSRNGSPSSSQLLPIYTTLPWIGGFNGSAPPSGGAPTATTKVVPLSRMSSIMHNSMVGHPHASGMVNSFPSNAEATHRRSTFGVRRSLRRTRRHLRRRLHDWRVALHARAASAMTAMRQLGEASQQTCARTVRLIATLTATRAAFCANAVGRGTRACLHRATQRWSPSKHPESAFLHEADSSVPLSRRGESEISLAAMGTPPNKTVAEAAATAEGGAKKPEAVVEQETLDANSMEEAINKVVEMLAPSPGRVPTVVVIRAPLGYDVTNDADSLWGALQLDSACFEEGLLDVVMMEELKTEPLPPARPAQTFTYTGAAQPPVTPTEPRKPSGEVQRDGFPGGSERPKSLPHPLSLDSASDINYEQQQQQQQQRPSAGRANPQLHTPPPERLHQRAPSPSASPKDKKADMRITFELYPAHIFYSSIIRGAILQEKDLALRRAAAELYGGVADLEDGTGNCAAGGNNGGAADGIGGFYGSPSSPPTLAHAASSSGISGGQRSNNNSHMGSAGVNNILNSVENFCLTPITPGHFLRASNSPKLSGMHHAHSSPVQCSGHHHSTITTSAGNNHSLVHGSSGLPLLPLPPPSLPLGPAPSAASAAAAAAAAAGMSGAIPSPTSLSPAFTPSMPGSSSNVVVRLSASYSFPALPPQIVRSPLQGAQSAGPQSARGASQLMGSLGTSALNPYGNGGGIGGGMSSPGLSHMGHRRGVHDRYSSARRFVNRSEVLFYIHVLRAVVADAPANRAVLSSVMSDFGEEDSVAANSTSDMTASVGSAAHRGATASPNTSIRTARPPSTTVASRRRDRRYSYDDEAGGSGNVEAEEAGGVNDSDNVRDGDGSGGSARVKDEREEERQTLLELRQREIEAPVLLRYRLRIYYQGTRSLEALKRTEKYAQDHVHVWQEEAKNMLQAMPPTQAASTVSALASGQRLSSLSTPSLMMTSSPVLRPADSTTARLPPPVASCSSAQPLGGSTASPPRPMQRSSSRFSLLPTLSVRTAPLVSNQDLEQEDDHDSGPLHLPAWAMEVLIRRESMRETLIRDLKEKAFRVCVIPLPDMRVHCLLPPVVPRYAVAHARGFPLSRTFAEEVLSQQRTLQYILLQREQENQRIIAAQIRRALRRQERHARHRRERRAREEERLRQQGEKKKRESLKARLASSINPAAIVSRVASMVKKSTGRDSMPLSSTEKLSTDGAMSVTTHWALDAAVSLSTSQHESSKSDARVAPSAQQRKSRSGTGNAGANSATLPDHHTAPSSLDAPAGFAAPWTVEDTTAQATADSIDDSPDAGEMAAQECGDVAHSLSLRKRQLLPPPPPPPPPQQEQQAQQQHAHRHALSPHNRRVSDQNLTSPTEHEVHFLGDSSSHTSTSFGTPQEPMLTSVLPTTVTVGTTSNRSGGSSSNALEALNGSPSNNTSGEQTMRGSRWSSPLAGMTPASAPPAPSLGVVASSLRSSPAASPLAWQAHTPQPLSTSSSQANMAYPQHSTTSGGGGSGGRTSPLSLLSATRSSNWTAVHTATNANTSVTPPPPPLVAPLVGAGATFSAATTRGESAGLFMPNPHVTSSSVDLSMLEEGEDTSAAALSPAVALHKPSGVFQQSQQQQLQQHSQASRSDSPDDHTDALFNNHYHSSNPTSRSLRSSGQVSPLAQKEHSHQHQQQQQPLSPEWIVSQRDGIYCPPTPPSNQPMETIASSAIIAAAAAAAAAATELQDERATTTNAGTLDADPNRKTEMRGGSLEMGVTPPVLYFTRPQSAVGMMSTPPLVASKDTLFSRPSLLVPTPTLINSAKDATADTDRVFSSRSSLSRSPLPQDAMPTSSLTSNPPAVPNNSMYGTFDAYYGHSTATPQAVLLRQQAQAAAVAGLTSAGVASTESMPTHARRSPGVSSYATGRTPVVGEGNSTAATDSAAGFVPTKNSCGTGVPALGSTDTAAGSHNNNNNTRLPSKSPNSVKHASPVPAHTTPRGGESTSTHLHIPRTSLCGGGSSAPRRTGSGLLPYTYSADSVSSRYGTAHYPLYQYPDDSASDTVGGLGNVTSATAIFASTPSIPGVAQGGQHSGWGPAGTPRMVDSPIDGTDHWGSGGAATATAPGVVPSSHMNRLKQYNKLLSDLLGVAGGPMRSGISFYYTYGDATALLYNASIQAPSDEDILKLLEHQQWQPPQSPLKVNGDASSGDESAKARASEMSATLVKVGGDSGDVGGQRSSSSGKAGGGVASKRGSEAATTPNSVGGPALSPQGSGNGWSNESGVRSVSPTPSAAGRVPATLMGIGDSPPTPSGSAGAHASSGRGASNTNVRGGAMPTNLNNPNNNNGAPGVTYEDEGCSYLDYGDMTYPEDAMDALEAEQIDAQRTRNKHFYSIFEHLHRAYHDALFEPRENAEPGRSHSPYGGGLAGGAAGSRGGGVAAAAAAAARQSPPPLGGFTSTASFSGSPGSPHSAAHAQSFSRSVLAAPYRAYTYACALMRWVGWKFGLAAAPMVTARGSMNGDGDVAGATAFCGVHSSTSDGFSSAASLPASSAQDECDAERLAKRFPGERIVTFGKEWRVASQLDMHNGQYGLSPLQVWMATRYSRRFAGEVYLMDVVAAGSDPYYPAVRVLDEVVAHAVLYYHNHSLRDFTEDLASELGLEYVPQTAWGRRALGLPMNETEVHELDGLLYTAVRRRQDRRRRQQETKRQHQQHQAQRAKQRKPRGSAETHSHPLGTSAAKETATTQSTVAATSTGGDAFVEMEYGNDADRPHTKPTPPPLLPRTRVAPIVLESTQLTEAIANAEEGGEDAQRAQQKPAPLASVAASRPLHAAAECNLVSPIPRKTVLSTTVPPFLAEERRQGGRCSPSSDDNDCPDPFDGVNEGLWIEMQSYDQEEDEEVFYGATAAAVVGIGSGDINMAPHIYDPVMEREVYDERMLLRELDHLKDFLIKHRNVLSSAMLTTTGSNALEAVFGVPATVFPFLLCARESVPLVSSIFESLSYHYGALTYDNFSQMTSDAYHVDRPDVLRHTPRLFRMVNKSRRGCITYEELCGWLARKLSCGNNVQPNAHLLAAIMSLRLPLALVAESREDWGTQRCALKSLSDAEDEEY